MICPSCKSENIQTIKMMCLSGTSSGNSTAVGITTDLDIGVAALTTKSQTTLATMLSPGPTPTSTRGFGIFFFVLAAFMFLMGISSASQAHDASAARTIILLTLPFSAGCGFLGYKYAIKQCDEKNMAIWKHKVKLYESGWICHKCGHRWMP